MRSEIGPSAVRVAIARFGALLFQAMALVLLARVLGAYDLGLYSLVLLVQSLIAVVSNLGVVTTSRYHAGRGEVHVERILAAGLIATVVGTVVLAPATSFMLSWLSPVLLPGLPLDLLVIGVMAGPVRVGYETLLGVFVGTGDITAQVRVGVVSALSLLVGLAVAATLGLLSVRLAVQIWLVTQILALVLALYEFRRHGGLVPPRGITLDGALWRAILRLGAAGYLLYPVIWASNRLDRVTLNLVAGTEQLGAFALAAWIAESFLLIPYAIGNVVYPDLRGPTSNDRAALASGSARSAVLVGAILYVPTVVALAVAAVFLGGTALSSGTLILAALLPGYILLFPLIVASSYLIAQGKVLVSVSYYAALAAAKVVVIVALYQVVGVFGVAVAISILLALTGSAAAAQMARAFGGHPWSFLVPGPVDLRQMITSLGLATRLAARSLGTTLSR